MHSPDNPISGPGRVVPLARALVIATIAALLGTIAPAVQAETACLADPAGDVRDPDGASTDAAFDITVLCLSYHPDGVEAYVRVSEKLDPNDPATLWADPVSLTVELSDQTGTAAQPDILVSLVGPANIPPRGDAGGGDGEPAPPAVATWLLFDREGQPCGEIAYTTPAASPYYSVSLSRSAVEGCMGAMPDQLFYNAFMLRTGGPSDEVPPFDDGAGRYSPIPLTTAVDVALAGAERVAGATRVATAIAASLRSFPVPDSAGAVVLASGDDRSGEDQPPSSPDALAAGPLAVAVDGPLLLTQQLSDAAAEPLSPGVADEIDRVLSPGATIYVVGGPAAVGGDVDDALRARGYDVRRLAGCERQATSLLVAGAIVGQDLFAEEDVDRVVCAPPSAPPPDEMPEDAGDSSPRAGAQGDATLPGTIAFAEGVQFQPALVAAGYVGTRNRAASGSAPGVLLLVGDGQPMPDIYEPLLEQVTTGASYIAVGSGARTATDGRFPVAADPVAGFLRPFPAQPVTSGVAEESLRAAVELASYYDPQPEGLARLGVIASNADFPDGLVGGYLAGRDNAPLYLTRPDTMPSELRQHLAFGPRFDGMVVLGGMAALHHQIDHDVIDCAVSTADRAGDTACL